MYKFVFVLLVAIAPLNSHAFWGASNIPHLIQSVANTLKTLHELERQSAMMRDQMAGIRDRIDRVQTISNLIQPSEWDQWKDPNEALRRPQLIYHTMPEEYRSEKSDGGEAEIARAMNIISRVGLEADSSFRSGKELERRGADASPGVAQKLTASGVVTLVSLESQSQVIQSHIVSFLSQMLLPLFFTLHCLGVYVRFGTFWSCPNKA